MDILEQMKIYEKEKNALSVKASKLKSDFQDYITDQSVPLMDRWAFFVKADDEFKNHSNYIISAKTIGLQYVLDNWFSAPEVYGRGKRVDIADKFQDCVMHDQIYPENFSYKMDKEEAEKCLIEALEEILEENIGSFCIDW